MIKLQFYPADPFLAARGFLTPHKTDKPFDVECEEIELESVIRKQVTSFSAYVINYYLGGQRMGVKYEGQPYYTVNGKFYHPLPIANASIETVVENILSSCGFYNGIGDMSKKIVNSCQKPTLSIIK